MQITFKQVLELDPVPIILLDKSRFKHDDFSVEDLALAVRHYVKNHVGGISPDAIMASL